MVVGHGTSSDVFNVYHPGSQYEVCAYAPATRCPVLTARSVLCDVQSIAYDAMLCYAMSGTELVYGATREGIRTGVRLRSFGYAISLRDVRVLFYYATSGTELAYGATRMSSVRYWVSYLPTSCYAMSGIDLAHGLTLSRYARAT
eukprot:3745982-Rhodomonas_salina.1